MNYTGNLISSFYKEKPDVQNVERIIEIANRMIAMEPDRAMPWMSKAYAYIVLIKTEDALECIDRALEIDPSDPQKWYLKAMILRIDGREDEADQCEEKASMMTS